MTTKWIAALACAVVLAGCSASSSGSGAAGLGGGGLFGAGSPGSGDQGSGVTGQALATEWGFTYATPDKWKAQDKDPFTFLGSDSEPGAIAMVRGVFTTAEEANGAVANYLKEQKIAATVLEGPEDATVGDMRATQAVIGAYDAQGNELRGRYITLFSDYQTSFTILSVTTTPNFDHLRATTDALAATIHAVAPAVNTAVVQRLVGKWTAIHSSSLNDGTATGSSSTASYVFDAAGNFSYTYEGSADVFVPGGSFVSGASSDSDQGTFTVIGGFLITKGQKGTNVYPGQLTNDGEIVIGSRTYYADGH
jgi:hypothetical protein